MLKIVYPICCGLDVHRDFVFACIATTENGITTCKSHRFSTFTKEEVTQGSLIQENLNLPELQWFDLDLQ